MLNSAEYEFSSAKLLVLSPRHGASFGKLFLLSSEKVATVLNHVFFMALDEVIEHVVDLWHESLHLLSSLFELDLRFDL